MLKKIWSWIIANESLVILVCLSLVLRLPSLFEPYWYGDEGIYLTLGWAFRQGLVWYRDIHDNKPPLLYLLAAFTGTVFWFRLFLAAWFAAAVVIFRRLTARLLPKPAAAKDLAALLLIVITTIFEGNVANAEIFIVLPVASAFLLALKLRPNWGIIGLLFSAGFLFKIPAAFDFFALLIWACFWKKQPLRRLAAAGIGFGLPVILSVGYYGLNGAFTPYVRSALMQNIGYLSSWNSGQSGLIPRLGIALAATFTLFIISRRRRLKDTVSLTLIWFIWAMFGALLSERPYPHYLIQPAVPLAILIFFFSFNRQRLTRLLIIILGLVAGLAYYQIRFWQYPVIGYYQNFWRHLTKQIDQEEYWRWFDQRVPQTYRLAAYVRRTTLPDQKIFIWGDEPYIYALSRRLPINRYTVAYHIIDFNGFNETLTAWDRKPPELVITFNYENRRFLEMESRLATDYLLTATIDQAKIYRRLKGSNQ